MSTEAISGGDTEDAPDRSRTMSAAARSISVSRNHSSAFPQEGITTAGGGSAYAHIARLFHSYAPLGYWLPFEVMDHVEILSTYNPDYSQAVDNIRSLANSGHQLIVEADSELRQRRIKSLLESKARTIQVQHGGIDGVIDKLLDQAATYGAMCGEWVLNDELTDVVDFVDINPKHIRFFWDEQFQGWHPYQKVTGAQAEEARERKQEVRNGNHVRLNTETFHYFAFDAAPQSPYGTPPFVASLKNIGIQDDMVENMSQIVKKLGLLGIVDMTVEQLPSKAGESPAEYEARAAQYLDAYALIVDDMVRDGGLVHFDDAELKTTSLGGNAAGATNIFKQNEELIFSGLKSMPSVQGRSYSSTETYAGVAYDIIVRNTKKYQRACKRMIEAGYWLICTTNGEQPKGINVKFKDNKTLQRLQEAQADEIEIRNDLTLWGNGIIDQQDFALRRGFDSAKRNMEEPASLTADNQEQPPDDAGEDGP